MNPDYRVTHMDSNQWKLPLNLAIGFHVLIVLSSIYLPGFFKAKPKFAEIYTVSIINVAEPVITPPPPPPAPKVQQPKAVVKKRVKPVIAKKVAPIAEPTPTTSNTPVKAVSLKPLKRKVVKKKVKPKVVNQPKAKAKSKQKKDNLAKKRRQELADAIREEELLTERARLAKEAVEMEKNLLKPRKYSPVAVKSSSNAPRANSDSTTVSSSSSSQVERMYYAAITNRLLQFWALPESIQKQLHLMSTAVITINKNGDIADILMENRSGDRVFDQFVTKTIRAANPMPAIPAAMRKQRVEIGLNFKPGGIQ